jgi:hypothetical protein
MILRKERHTRKFYIAILATVLAVPALGGCTGDKKPDARPATVDTAHKGGTAVTGVVDTTSPAADPAFQSGEAISDPATTYKLRLTPNVGDQFSYRISRHGTSALDTIVADESYVYTFTAKVTGVNSDGSIAMQMKYDDIRVHSLYHNGPGDAKGRSYDFPSSGKSDSNDRQGANYRALLGQNVNLTLSKEGEVREVSNLEPIMSKLLGKLRDSIPSSALTTLRESIKLQAFQLILQQMFLQSPPDSAVGVGKEWVRRDSTPMLGIPSSSAITYKLLEVRKVDDRPVGRVQLALTSEFPKKKMDDKNVSVTIDQADVHGVGEALVNLANGFPIRKNTKIDVVMKITSSAKVGPGKGQSQSLSQKQSTATSVELLDFKPAAK